MASFGFFAVWMVPLAVGVVCYDVLHVGHRYLLVSFIGFIASKSHRRKPCIWSCKFKRTVATSSHSSATWLPPRSGHKRPVFKYCLYNNRIFLTVQSGRLQWENQGFFEHWCSFARQIQVQGQHALLRWDHPSGVGLRPA